MTPSNADPFAPTDTFVRRHIGPSPEDVRAMCATIGVRDLDELVERTIPRSIRAANELTIGPEGTERAFLDGLREVADQNSVLRSYLGQGYYGTVVPEVLKRNILLNPGWYTQYTPYQAEISQGRLEALLNFQTMVADLTGFELANASLLDEATAAAEGLCMAHRILRGKRDRFFVADTCHPQTIAVCRTRAEALGLTLEVGAIDTFDPASKSDLAAVLLQYPDTLGAAQDYEELVGRIHDAGALVVVATDLLALTLLRPPGEFGADMAVGSAQRFGVPLGYGGPHAAFLATHEKHKRQIPGRMIGLSRDVQGRPALRMAMQTREQHIRREKATSNICTAQVLLAILAGAYAVYHGPQGLRTIAARVHHMASVLAAAARRAGFTVPEGARFDTLSIGLGDVAAERLLELALARGINLRQVDAHTVAIALDETAGRSDLVDLIGILGEASGQELPTEELLAGARDRLPTELERTSSYLEHPTFNRYHAEHEMLRYLKRLEARDLSLTTSMIPLGSCTMKLNATVEMVPITWPAFSNLHPFVPVDQAAGYMRLFHDLESALCDITGFHAVTLQPNAGSQGEYTGLLVIRAWHESRGDAHRNVCLIPVSAHGTNPASAILAGMRVVAVACDDDGNIDLTDLRAKATQHSGELAALMVTYPSTHGVFEEGIREVCDIVHEHGGQVYLDGANMNAQVGLCRPGDYGADVCHLNLHKTFCIPHGGGGPGMGPIGVGEHLAPFLPGHPNVECGGESAIGPVAAAPWGSPSILPISWAYISLMGSAGLRRATEVAILNANYMAKRLSEHFPILYRGEHGMVAHEFILDLRPFERSTGVVGEDVAKRLMDYGFHAPTLSFPVIGTLMVEPTESESRAELDRLCDALIAIRGEITDIAEGRLDATDNPLKNAPHTAHEVCAEGWSHGYSRERAAFPAPWTRDHKFWPAVARVDNGFGDRNLICSCPPMEAYDEEIPRPAPQPGTPEASIT